MFVALAPAQAALLFDHAPLLPALVAPCLAQVALRRLAHFPIERLHRTVQPTLLDVVIMLEEVEHSGVLVMHPRLPDTFEYRRICLLLLQVGVALQPQERQRLTVLVDLALPGVSCSCGGASFVVVVIVVVVQAAGILIVVALLLLLGTIVAPGRRRDRHNRRNDLLMLGHGHLCMPRSGSTMMAGSIIRRRQNASADDIRMRCQLRAKRVGSCPMYLPVLCFSTYEYKHCIAT